jgi:hypothetical protein
MPHVQVTVKTPMAAMERTPRSPVRPSGIESGGTATMQAAVMIRRLKAAEPPIVEGPRSPE